MDNNQQWTLKQLSQKFRKSFHFMIFRLSFQCFDNFHLINRSSFSILHEDLHIYCLISARHRLSGENWLKVQWVTFQCSIFRKRSLKKSGSGIQRLYIPRKLAKASKIERKIPLASPKLGVSQPSQICSLSSLSELGVNQWHIMEK